jgi:hypothetical protein
MPLDMTALSFVETAAPAPSLITFASRVWKQKLIAAASLRRAKAQAEKQAREADKLWKAAQTEILIALGNAPGATCDGLVVTKKEAAPSAATITLTNGTVIPLSNVTAIVVGKSRIDADQIAKVYGGREASPSVDIAGA